MNSVTRALRRFVSKLTGKNQVIFFVVLFLICVVAICIAIYGQYFYKYSDTDPLMLGIRIGAKKTTEEFADLKANFQNLFTNEVHSNIEKIKIDKIDSSQNAVYTYYSIQNDDENFYHVDVNLPIININNEAAKSINSKIAEKFYNKANTIMRTAESFITYKTDYVAYINNGVISIAIRETSKEGNKAEKVVVTTYNYSIPNKSELTLQDLIILKETDNNAVQSTIDSTIQAIAKSSSELAQEFGNAFVRNPDDSMYKLENAKAYFLTDDGYVYIVYSYGETKNTNEVDVVIF